ncbi:MAG: hypothetical protein QOF48_2998 [Verrucomicrobiota bacterium]
MLLGAVFISGQQWLVPAAAFLAVAGGLLWWSYRFAPASPGLRAACVGLKLIGLLALAACLLEPLWTRQRVKPGANFFVVLADNSQGLQIKDRAGTGTRGEALRALLVGPQSSPWQAKLDENFQVRRYLFDTRVQSTRDFSELAFEGRSTALASALKSIAARYHGQPLAGVLLLSGGNATDLTEGALDVAGLPPIYPVVIGSDDAVKDISVQKIAASQTVFEDAPVTIQGEVSASGYGGGNIVARLMDVTAATNAASAISNKLSGTTARLIAKQIVKAPKEGETAGFRFQIKPERPGLTFYRLEVAAEEDAEEATLANNSRTVVVDRGRGPYRILYVAGRPNWEFKFLNRALMEDDQLQLVGLIRIARREPKFDFRGREGESSNPLFRGFGNQSKEDTERYDQPVLIRLNTRDEFELRGGFPKVPEDLYGYDAIIVDDLEAEFFTPDQMALVQKFVSERGGGFLMLGGAESFREGKFQRTPIGDLLPVYMDNPPETRSPGQLRINLTREGFLQPWARLRNNETDEKKRLTDVAPFGVLNKVRGVKPGASVIATVSDEKNAVHPAIVAQRFGNGRVGAVLLGDIWHWGFKDEASHRDMDKAWRQLTRWLIADVPKAIDLQAQPRAGDPDNAVLLQIRAKDKRFLPIDNATVSVLVHKADVAGSNAVRITAEPSAREAGLFEAIYVPRETGGYQAQAIVTGENGAELGRAEAGWTSDPGADEFRSLKPNKALLESIARRTGGEMVPAGGLDAFAAMLPNKKAPITESWSSPLWHQAGVFLFALACFVTEWGLRRWRGLA